MIRESYKDFRWLPPPHPVNSDASLNILYNLFTVNKLLFTSMNFANYFNEFLVVGISSCLLKAQSGSGISPMSLIKTFRAQKMNRSCKTTGDSLQSSRNERCTLHKANVMHQTPDFRYEEAGN